MVPRICIVIGSKNDLPAILSVLEKFPASVVEIIVHVMSCHRNPEVLREFCERMAAVCGFTAIIGVGGKALALPGIIDAWLRYYKVNTTVIGVALGKKDTVDFSAACLSISCLPSTPVLLDEAGNCYRGPEGLEQAISRIIDGQLPAYVRKEGKPHEWNVWSNYQPNALTV